MTVGEANSVHLSVPGTPGESIDRDPISFTKKCLAPGGDPVRLPQTTHGKTIALCLGEYGFRDQSG